MSDNWLFAWIFFWSMSSRILSRSNISFDLTLPLIVFDLTPDTLIYPGANNDTEDENNVRSDAISSADILVTALIL